MDRQEPGLWWGASRGCRSPVPPFIAANWGASLPVTYAATCPGKQICPCDMDANHMTQQWMLRKGTPHPKRQFWKIRVSVRLQ